MGQSSSDATREVEALDPAKLGQEAATGAWFFENARELFGVISAEGIFLQVNPAWEQVTGWTSDELIGRHFGSIVHEDSHQSVSETGKVLVRDGYAETSMQIVCRSGALVWLEGYSRTGPQGEMMGMLRDVTEERHRAEDLRRAKQTQSLLSETAGVGLWRYDPRTDVIEWSAEWTSMLAEIGVSMSTPDDFAAVCHPDDVEQVFEVMDHSIASGVPGAFTHRFRAADGSWIWADVHIRTEPAGDGVHIIHGISQNVTALRNALAAVTEAQREAETNTGRLKIALAAAKAAVVEIDYEGRAVWASPELQNIAGPPMTFDEARRSVWPFVYAQDAGVAQAAVRGWLKGAAPEPLEVRVVAPDGLLRWVRIYTEIEKDQAGRWRRSISLLVDVDERHRQEQALIEAERLAQHAAEAKSQFLANMSHEIRTPMNGVLGVLHLLKSQSLPDQAQDMLAEALACGAMLQALLDDVVDFSRIEAGRLELDLEPVDPAALLQGVVKLLRPQAEDKGLTMGVQADTLPPWAMTSDVRLRQCLFNLIGNAVKFTQSGSVNVRAMQRGEGPDLRLRFEIEDTGIGISAASQQQLFQRFQQADASTTRRFGGSGLGLAITSRLAALMGGELGVTSQEGRGSLFWLEIAAPAVAAPGDAVAAVGEVLEGLSCLVVEDNATNRMIATKLLEGLGALVETAENGELGVETALRGNFDLILMDIQMPGIDGMEATRRIRASESPAAITPIIALTANALSHQRQEYLAAGMDGMVGKPISPAVLLKEIARLSEGSNDGSAQGDANQPAGTKAASAT